MKEAFEIYIQEISKKASHVETSEMGYRADLEILLRKIFSIISGSRIGHDTKAKGGNKPDFIIFNKEIPLLYIETKDIGISLDKIEESEQMKRYFGYSNLILTDYLEFRFYRNGMRYGENIRIASYNSQNRSISPNPEKYLYLAKAILNFTKSYKEPIKSGKHLSQIMGGKAQRIRNDIRLFTRDELKKETALIKLYDTLKKLLVHDLTLSAFADMYAQTLVYGLFVARYHDKTPGNFSRQEARELIPNSNPFLRHFFDHIVGADFDTRLKYIVDELCEVFSHANVNSLMEEYYKIGKKTNDEKLDPVIHFYEDFLQEYDPELRKKMGAYYTPQQVVNFIVDSIDEILKKDFELVNGLANATKLPNGRHKVQLLDPATGTGTFISAVINQIHKSIVANNQEGRWFAYIHNDLLPRIHGFELMMAPYTISHLRLGIEFRKMGFWDFHRRLGIYLTNSLEGEEEQEDLFTAFGLAESIAEESKEANVIKSQTPIMVVLGNPPYSVSSSNKGKWIQNLIKVYKEDLNEKKINLDDDYIKFIRLAENYIEQDGTGVVAMITNNSFIDGITHRQMRKHLLETFDDIYILDLHGNSKKKERCPDGSKDENVFDIMQGVSINIFVRRNKTRDRLGKLHHLDLFGTRETKLAFLTKYNIKTVNWNTLNYTAPYYFFVPKNFELDEEYRKGFKVNDLFVHFNSGIQTKNDALTIQMNDNDLDQILTDFTNMSLEDLKIKYPHKDTSGWTTKKAKESLLKEFYKCSILYRPFDVRKTVIQNSSGGFIGRSRFATAKHFIKENLGIVTVKQQSTFDFQHVLATKFMIESGAISLQTKEWGYIFPLYLYLENGTKASNLKEEIVSKINKIVGNATPEDIFSYVYAVLNSPKYRERYKELLKIDFPIISYPKDIDQFKRLVSLGTKLKELHLLESPDVYKFITSYPNSGSDTVKVVAEFKEGKVFINEEQYFGDVPKEVWEFYIGGYQPAQKWLKDRKGKTLTNDDIEHYQKMIVAIKETIDTMKEIDLIMEF